jgi:hypothetical protein
MNFLPGYALTLLLAVGAPPGPTGWTEAGRPRPGGSLSEADACYLDDLTQDFLFDPKGAVRVRVWFPARGNRYIARSDHVVRVDTEAREGWLVPAAPGRPARVYFTDGESIPVPRGRVDRLDFEADCARRLRPRPAAGSPLIARLFRLWDGTDEDTLTLAAWLHRRGYDRLAARALEVVRAEVDAGEDPRAGLRQQLAERAADALRDAFCARADAEALAHGERLLRLYPDMAEKNHPQGAAVVADLKRRQKAGTFGKPAPKDLPAGFAGWAVDRKVAFLIAALDEIEGTSGRFGLGERNPINDWQYQALVALGEPALLALIDAIERDGRLTRCPVPEPRGGCIIPPRSERGRVYTARAVWPCSTPSDRIGPRTSGIGWSGITPPCSPISATRAWSRSWPGGRPMPGQ